MSSIDQDTTIKTKKETAVSKIKAIDNEIERLKNVMYNIVKSKTDIKNPEEAFNKDMYYTAQTAREFNIIDKIK